MKNFFLVQLFFAAIDAAGGGTTPQPIELTSETLTTLKASRKAAWAEMLKNEDPDTAEALAAKQAVWKIDGEIAAEKQLLQKAVNDAKLAESRKERLQLNENQFVAYDALNSAKSAKYKTEAEKTEAIATAQTAFDTAKELVNNELLNKFGVAKKPKAEGEQSEGSKSEQKAAILELYKAGKKHSEIEAAGYARSTVWHVINKAILAGEVEKLH